MKNAAIFAAKWGITLFIVSVVAFAIPRFMPGNPVEILFNAYQIPSTLENIAMMEKEWGLDRPILHQYFHWISNFAHGNWGKSLVTHVDIFSSFQKKVPYSIAIGLGGILLSSIFAFFCGYRAALHEKGFCDKFTRFLSIFSLSVPSFLLSVIVIYYLGVELKLIKFFSGDGQWGLIFGIIFMCIYTLGSIARVAKIHFKEEMEQTYYKFSLSRGFSREYVLLKHSYKPVICGIISIIISKFAWVLGGSTVIEFAFAIPGISAYLIESMQRRDYYVLQSYLMVLFLWMMLSHVFFNAILLILEKKGSA